MKPDAKPGKHADLNGSKQHFPLKNRDGEAGDSEHAASDEALEGEMAETVKSSGAETQIADALRDLTKNS